MLMTTASARMTFSVVVLLELSHLGAWAANMDTNAVMAWVSPTNYFSHVKLEVSRNFFLADNDPDFTQAPDEMVAVEGALLPESFYVMFGSGAYGAKLVVGESATHYWSLSPESGGLVFAKKSSSWERDSTNSLAIQVRHHRDKLRGWMQSGLFHVQPGDLQIETTNFTAAGVEGRKLKGWFSTPDEQGIPSVVGYKVVGAGEFGVTSTLGPVKETPGHRDFVSSLWKGGQHWKTFKVVVVTCAPADRSDLDQNFIPSDFLPEGSSYAGVGVVSNDLRYDLLPSGELVPLASDLQESTRKRNRSLATFAAWGATGLILIAGVAWGLRAKGTKTNQA